MPPPRAHLTRYHGVFAARARLREALRPATATGEAPASARGGVAARQKRPSGAELLARVFEEDVLACARCGGRRQVIAIVADPKQARQTLEELGMKFEPLRLAKARSPPVLLDLPPPGELEGIAPIYPEQ